MRRCVPGTGCLLTHALRTAGKSTLADQLLIRTGTVEDRDMQASPCAGSCAAPAWEGPSDCFLLQAQFLDALDLERERGITIKLNQVQGPGWRPCAGGVPPARDRTPCQRTHRHPR